jgi:hypothetical protein
MIGQNPRNFSLRKRAILGNMIQDLSLKPVAVVPAAPTISPLLKETTKVLPSDISSTLKAPESAGLSPSDTSCADSGVSKNSVPSSSANTTAVMTSEEHTETHRTMCLFEMHARRFRQYGYHNEEPWGERFLEIGRRVYEDLTNKEKNNANEDFTHKSRLNRFQR